MPQSLAQTVRTPPPGTLLLFAGALFLSAGLVFSVQPLLARLLLPSLGGSPAVWNTALVFFQAALLAGYAYAHASSRFLPPVRQVALHALLLLLAFAVLPFGLPAGATPPAGTHPSLWLLGTLAVSVGPPFLALAATAPLLQAWFARSGHREAKDPYFLYAASNAGSMAGLLGYPLLAEPFLRLAGQSQAWMAGYVVLGGLVLLAGAASLWSSPAKEAESAAQPAGAPAWRQRLIWMALAFLPSSLLLGVTNHITTDIAAVPLLWVAPLALYLLSFILVFARRPLIPGIWWLKAQPAFLISLTLLYSFTNPVLLIVLVHLLAFFLTAMVCHGQLAAQRPEARHLTGFYLWMSLGGALGGAATALLAPLLFNQIVEYPLALILVCLLRPWPVEGRRMSRHDVLLPALLAAGLFLLHRLGFSLNAVGLAGKMAFCFPLGLLLYSFSRRPLRFALGFGASFVLLNALPGGDDGKLLFRERTFFGVYKVTAEDGGSLNALVHGTTIHGAQFTQAGQSLTPLTYYAPSGPLGQIFAALRERTDIQEIGAVGLGSGAAACHPPFGRRWTFFEIDPLVARIASSPRLFTYLRSCAPDAKIIIGDARLSLAAEPDGRFDLLILDAFSSDAIPVHLMTAEAVALYAAKLAPGGLIAWHITNRNLKLAGVAANALASAGLAARLQSHRPSALDALEEHVYPSIWIIAARRSEELAFLEEDNRWTRLEPQDAAPHWTDDFSNVIGILKLK
jgi:hypothetical protein